MGLARGAAWAAIWTLVPAVAAAQEAPVTVIELDGDAEAAEELDLDEDVAGTPLRVGEVPERTAPVPPPPPFIETDDGWGIPEHRLYAVPKGTEQPPLYQGDVARIPPPPWPGKHLLASEPFPAAWTYPELYPLVNVAFESTVGELQDEPVLIERAELNLYVLEIGVDLVRAVGEERVSQPSVDLDFRIPIPLSEHSRLALMPGMTFAEDRPEDEPFAARTRLIYGYGRGAFAFQVNGGYAVGPRPGGLLGNGEGLTEPTILTGGLVAFRVHEKWAPRIEADLGFATDRDDPDFATLAAGVNYSPWGDPRLEIGLAAILEDAEVDLFDDPSVGGLLELQVNFL